MVFQNNNAQQGSDIFTLAMQRRMEMMQRNADELFSIGWLRKRLWMELTNNVHDTVPSEYANYRHVLQGSYESRFLWEFLSVYQKSLPYIKRVIDNAYDDADSLQELMADREELIGEFARMPLSRTWEHVRDDDDSWRKFARRMPLGDQGKQADITAFFELLDRISLMTDILCGRAKEYGLDVDYSSMEEYRAGERRAQLSAELLVKAIEDWAAWLNGKSDWTVPFCVLRDDHGMTNASEFERNVAGWKFSKQLPDCPEGTVSRTMSNNRYMYLPIDKWPADKKFTKPAQELRKCIDNRLKNG